MKLIVGVIVEHDDNDKKVENEIFFHKINEQTIILETNSNVFVGSLGIRCNKVNKPKDSSYICHLIGWDIKMLQQIQKILMVDVFSMLLHSHNTIKKSKIILNKNPKNTLILLFGDIKVAKSQFKGGEYAKIHKSINNQIYLNTILEEKKKLFSY